MAQLGKKYSEEGDITPVAVSLDREKAPMMAYAQRLAGWSVLCDYKGMDSKAAKDYGIKGVPGTVLIDARGRIRLPESMDFMSEKLVEDLKLEAFWAKKRGAAPATEAPKPADPAAPPAAPPSTAVKWLIQLKSGGKLKAVSYEEKDGKLVIKLAAGSTTVSKEDVETISPVDPK